MASFSSGKGSSHKKSWNTKTWAVADGRKRRKKEQRMGEDFEERSVAGQLSVKELKGLMDEGIIELVIELEKDLKRFQKSLDKCEKLKKLEKVEFIKTIIDVISMVSQAQGDHKESANVIIAEFLSTRCNKFQQALSEYVQNEDFPTDSMTIRKLCNFCKFVIESFRGQIQALPVFALAQLNLPQDLAKQMSEVKELQKEFTKLQKQNAARSQIVKYRGDDPSIFLNWDNSKFRSMPILPTVEEVVGTRPPLRSNLIKDSYAGGWEHYYDVQFRLLREDFVAPLRRGISEYCNPNHTQRPTDVYIYEEVKILEPKCTQEGVCNSIKVLNIHKLNLRRSLEYTKRLMFGSLLCFTLDKFQKVLYFAVVTNRDPKDLRKGIVQVKFERPLDILQHIQTATFVVAESRAFFEASRHVLRSLQTAEVDTMPFTKQLIFNDHESCVKPPVYLNMLNGHYNLRAVYKDTWMNRGEIQILDENSWPKCRDSGVELDQSQLYAIKMALTQEIAIIQGPPGTGKTYIGYKIVQTLLENRNVWDPYDAVKSPILVMCFTNHALDQFLEGIIHHKIQGKGDHQERSPKIVRIGGRSKSEEIQKLGLKDVRRHLVPKYLYKEVQNEKNHCLKLGSDIEWRSATLQKIVQDPVSVLTRYNPLLSLKKFMHPSHFYQITQIPEDDNEVQFALDIWLGLREQKLVEFEVKAENDGLLADEAADYDSSVSDDDYPDKELIGIKGEAELEEETRKLETDNYEPLEAKRKEKKDDRLTQFVKMKLKYNTSSESSKEKRLVWVKKKERECEEIFYRIRHAKPIKDYDKIACTDITEDLFRLTKRYQLLRFWIMKWEQNMKASIQRDIVIFEKMCQDYKKADQGLDRIALEKAEVIGMTTTGAAKYQHIIHLVKPKIVIVEEAAELLESHIVSALNGGTQHLILIGDHKQLRPKPNEYDLAMKHNLHISLFERLILNGHPHATLEIQHRMREQIAGLVCPHIYDKLKNHESVLRYPNVKGFQKNMYFFDHNEKEEHNQQLVSHANEYEARFIVSLCRHLLKLAYDPSQITILTAYSGQLLKLMHKMPVKEFEGVKITNVDNFQGEENDIIILSLVRSNDYNSVGFLKEENRICVALSRARIGFFCFGNFNKLLRIQVPKWDQIISYVEDEGCLGNEFPLQCPNHDDFTFKVCKPEDFATNAPEGGCGKPCTFRLHCGHVCRRLCHIDDPEHENSKCKAKCSKKCENGHPCTGYCYESPCPPCTAPVRRTFLDCAHELEMKCSDPPICTARCDKECANGHQCKLRCYKGCLEKCQYIVKKEMPVCKHKQEMMCHQDPKNVRCKQKCQKIVCKNGHYCPKQCWEECGQCERLVDKDIPKCGHKARVSCSLDMSTYDCVESCEKKYNKCGHTCPLKCSEQCSPICMKLVPKQIPKCGHTQQIPCYRPPETSSCQMPCEKVLSCRHKCKNKCGEPCSSKYTCKELVELELPCKHIKMVECNQFTLMKYKVVLGGIDCLEPCEKLLKCNHKCRNKCSEPCTVDCPEITKKLCPKRAHVIEARCGTPVTSCDGRKPCREMLPCGHKCPNKCSEPCSNTCTEQVKYQCPCGHEHLKQCGDNSCGCTKKCRAVLECGHKCTGKCGECFESRIHPPCPFEVEVKRFCGHYAHVPCFGFEDKCHKVCRLATCSHTTTSSCKQKCYQPCEIDVQCNKPCSVHSCVHNKCTKVCSQCDDRSRCTEHCDKELVCGHQCFGLCGEKCLSLCLICDETKFLSALTDDENITKETLQESRYIELTCGHLFSVGFLDRHYQTEKDSLLISPFICPQCPKIITSCDRYSRLIKDRHDKIMKIKEAISKATDFDPGSYKRKLDELKLSFSKLRMANMDLDEVGCYTGKEALLILELLVEIGNLCSTLITENSTAELQSHSQKLFTNVLSLSKEMRGELSHQVIHDIKSEVYRISLLHMVSKAQKYSSKVDDLKKIIEQKANFDQHAYTSCVTKLKAVSPSIKILVNELDPAKNIAHLTSPVCTKGEYYCCSKAGHIYLRRTKYSTQQRQNSEVVPCPKCNSQ